MPLLGTVRSFGQKAGATPGLFLGGSIVSFCPYNRLIDQISNLPRQRN